MYKIVPSTANVKLVVILKCGACALWSSLAVLSNPRYQYLVNSYDGWPNSSHRSDSEIITGDLKFSVILKTARCTLDQFRF